MTMSEAFDLLEEECAKLGLLDEYGADMDPECVMGKVGAAFHEEDEMLMGALRSGEMTPLQFYSSYLPLIEQFKIKRNLRDALRFISDLSSA